MTYLEVTTNPNSAFTIMAIHDDNWTREFTIWETYKREIDWTTIIPVLIIFAVVLYSVVT